MTRKQWPTALENAFLQNPHTHTTRIRPHADMAPTRPVLTAPHAVSALLAVIISILVSLFSSVAFISGVPWVPPDPSATEHTPQPCTGAGSTARSSPSGDSTAVAVPPSCCPHGATSQCPPPLWPMGAEGSGAPRAMIWALVPRFCPPRFENDPGGAPPQPQGVGTAMAPWGQSSELSTDPTPWTQSPTLPACPWHFKRTSTAAEGPGRCFFLSARRRGAEGGAAIVSFSLMYSSHSIISTEQPFHLLSVRAALRRSV